MTVDDRDEWILLVATFGEEPNCAWRLIYDGGGGEANIASFNKILTPRNLPYKTMVGTADGWEINTGSDIQGLLILPVYSALTPWEHRRRWNLMG